MRLLSLFILLVLAVACAGNPSRRQPAAISNHDPCHEAMQLLMDQNQLRNSNAATGFVDEFIDRGRLIGQGKLSQADLEAIETSPEWRNFFLKQHGGEVTSEEQILVAALLRRADEQAPIEAVQRKYSLLFEFCGL